MSGGFLFFLLHVSVWRGSAAGKPCTATHWHTKRLPPAVIDMVPQRPECTDGAAECSGIGIPGWTAAHLRRHVLGRPAACGARRQRLVAAQYPVAQLQVQQPTPRWVHVQQQDVQLQVRSGVVMSSGGYTVRPGRKHSLSAPRRPATRRVHVQQPGVELQEPGTDTTSRALAIEQLGGKRGAHSLSRKLTCRAPGCGSWRRQSV